MSGTIPQNPSKSTIRLNPHLYPDRSAQWPDSVLEYGKSANSPDRLSPDAVNESRAYHEPLGAEEGKGTHPARHLVRLKAFRASTLDERNLFDKYFVDALVYAGAISGDSPKEIEIEVTQEKCLPVEERTEITIQPLEASNG
jgi:hypothetical protein